MSESMAKKLGVKHTVINLERDRTDTKKWWSVTQNKMVKLEVAVFDYYKNQGWEGCSYEGATLKFLLKCASVIVCNTLLMSDRERYIEAIYETYNRADPEYNAKAEAKIKAERIAILGADYVAKEDAYIKKRDEEDALKYPNLAADLELSRKEFIKKRTSAYGNLVENVKKTDSRKIQSVLNECEYLLHDGIYLYKTGVLPLYKVLGRKSLVKIAEKFKKDPYEYRKGWPDLTLWKDDKLIFCEVKGPNDRILNSQRTIIDDFFHELQLDFDYFIVSVK